jgi:LPS-assembly lipoprotein
MWAEYTAHIFIYINKRLLMHQFFLKAFYGKICFVFLSLLLISGCGFHLKHNNGLVDKYPKVFVQSSNPNSELVRFLKMRLRGAAIKIADMPTKESTIVTIEGVRSSSRTISLYVNAQNAEEELSYNLRYSIQNPGYPAKSFTFNLYRDFLENSEEALAKSREAELLEQEMHSIAADHIIATMLSLEKETKQQPANANNEGASN